ncbi:hypothetical protein [Ruegeria sp.]|uniref:hypothetical protein n=1 Tax=Ruegeria sp. TaxID=1879320 RepID=UPI003C7B64CA
MDDLLWVSGFPMISALSKNWIVTRASVCRCPAMGWYLVALTFENTRRMGQSGVGYPCV